MLNGVITRKLEALEETLLELESLGKVTLDTIQTNWLVRRAVERDLQILVEVVIDVCHRLISGAGTAPASSAIEAVKKCVRLGVLSSEEPFHPIVQFRDFIVHRHEHIDPEILLGFMNKHLQDFRLFREEVLHYVSKD